MNARVWPLNLLLRSALIGLAVAIAAWQVWRFLRVEAAAGLMRTYFINHWLLSYDAGFVRRGLLGAIGHVFGGVNQDLLVLHVVSLAIAIALAVLLQISLAQVLLPGWPALVVLLSVALSPVTALLLDALGDPTQIALLAAGLWMRPLQRWSAPIALGLSVTLVAIFALIHEASILLVGPALVIGLAMRTDVQSRRWANVTALSAGLVICLAVVTAWGQASADRTQALLPSMTAHWPGQPPSHQAGSYSLLFRSFRELLDREAVTFSAIDRATLLAKACVVPALLTIMVGWSGTWRVGRFWIALVLLAAPLFVIGRDWGRFVAYLWMMAVFLASTPSSEPTPAASSSWNTRGIALVAALLVAIVPIHEKYLTNGVRGRSLLEVLLVSPVLAWVWRESNRAESPLGST